MLNFKFIRTGKEQRSNIRCAPFSDKFKIEEKPQLRSGSAHMINIMFNQVIEMNFIIQDISWPAFYQNLLRLIDFFIQNPIFGRCTSIAKPSFLRVGKCLPILRIIFLCNDDFKMSDVNPLS